ncbi:NYN domain-containing protein [Aeromonas hydrophila]|uniref:NYN domain-containing protein n=1 Tax=Aeromonas hydrophila TaxID=644 RepID=UPI003EC79887
MKDKEKIAVFIDADNAPAGKMDRVLSELARYGVVNIRKAYGNWKNPTLKSWEEILHEFAIQPIQQFDLTKGKNATDMALVIDVMDVLYTKDVDVICLVSSDCDFTPLVTRCLADGKFVIGFGERKAPMPFVNSCSRFLYLDAELQDIQEEQPIGSHISNHASFDQRNYGFKKLSDLFMAIDLFEMKKTDNSVLWVRDKKRASQLTKSK